MILLNSSDEYIANELNQLPMVEKGVRVRILLDEVFQHQTWIAEQYAECGSALVQQSRGDRGDCLL